MKFPVTVIIIILLLSSFRLPRRRRKLSSALRARRVIDRPLAARVGLRFLGLDPEKDVTIITLGTDTLRHAALIAGTVQATHMPVPLNMQLKKEGYHELVYAGKILQRPLTGLATGVEKIQKNPGQV